MDSEYSPAPTQNLLKTDLLEAAENLAENLAQSEPFRRLRTAEERLSRDREAQQLLSDLSDLQQKVRTMQYSGKLSESDLILLRAMQSAVLANQTIRNHRSAQELAVGFLQEVNKEISQLLGIDFASLTRRSGGC